MPRGSQDPAAYARFPSHAGLQQQFGATWRAPMVQDDTDRRRLRGNGQEHGPRGQNSTFSCWPQSADEFPPFRAGVGVPGTSPNSTGSASSLGDHNRVSFDASGLLVVAGGAAGAPGRWKFRSSFIQSLGA